MKFFTKEVQIALVAIAGIAILFFGMRFLKGISLFGNDNIYYVTLDNVSGLSASSPVYADGYKVGTVKSINYDFKHEQPTRAEIGIDKNLRIPKGSRAEIETDMLGNVKLNLLLVTNLREHVNPGDDIPGGMSVGTLDKMATMIPQIEKMLPKLDSILASLNTLLADPAISQSLHNVNTITADLTTSTRQLNALLSDINAKAPSMIAKADRVLDHTETLTANLSQIDVSKTMADVDATISNVKELTARLNNSNGTLGKLMDDDTLYDNLTSTVRNADSLMIDLKQHPKRYVHFSVFGKKN